MSNKIKLFGLTILVYGIPILLWSIIPFTKNKWGSFASDFLFNYLLYGKISYSAIGIIFDIFVLYCLYILLRPDPKNLSEERVYMIASGAKKLFNWIFVKQATTQLFLSKEEKVSLLFYLVKLYFTPVMIGFLIDNTHSLFYFFKSASSLYNSSSSLGIKASMLTVIFPALFYFILIIDTVIFSFGYLFESKALKNTVKSVEPTAFGWLVAIACYPPLNNLTGDFLDWYSSDFADFGNINVNFITGIISILLFVVYVWASVALGFKASNLTNRGIVEKGPYKYVRHPAYASKNLSWWIMGIPFIKTGGFLAIFSLSAWSMLYFLRAITEERHLAMDPDYVEYQKKVKYMFIPGLF